MADMAPSVGFFAPETLEGATFQGAAPIDTRGVEQKLGDHLTYAAPAAAAGFVDTVGQSLGLLNETALSTTIKDVMPAFGSYYDRNQEGAKLAGDLVGMFIPGMMAMKVARAGSRLHTAVTGMKGGKYLGSMFTSGKNYGQLLEGVKARSMYLAERGVVDLATDATRAQLARTAISTKVLDTVKETVAFEMGVLATMNQSDVLYPDEFTTMDHITLATAVAVPFAGAEAAFMKFAIRSTAQKVSPIAHAARERTGVSVEETIFRPGNRDTGVTAYSLQSTAARDAMTDLAHSTSATTADKELGLTALNKEVISYESTIKTQLQRMGQDSPYKNVTTRVTLSDAEVKGMQNSLEKDPTTMMGTVSAQPVPATLGETLELMGKKQTEVTKLQKQLDEARVDLEAKSTPELATKMTGMQVQIDEIGELQYFVNEADGTLAHARMRKPIFQDGDRRISKQSATSIEAAVYKAEIPADPIYGANKAVIGVSADFQWIVPQVKEQKISGVNVTKVLPRIEVSKSSTHFKNLLHDMGADWHYKSGPRGKEIFNGLDPELQQQIKSWTGSSSASELRKWTSTDDPRYRKLYDAYQPVRDRLRELADDDGTIPLFRGESKAETKAPSNDVVSMTSSPQVAKGFGDGNVITRRVPVDDVVMIVGGLEGEFEFIVKGNTKRNLGERVTIAGFESLTPYQRSGGYAAAQRSVEDFKLTGDKLYVSTGDHHTRLDGILSLYEKHGEQVFDRINLPQGMKSLDDVEWASVKSKYVEYARLRKMMDASQGDKAILKLSGQQRLSQYDINRMLNLPGTPNGDMHPMVSVMETIYQEGQETMSLKSLEHFKRAMQENAFFPELTQFLNKDLRMRGHMMEIPTDAKPTLLIKRPISAENYTREALTTRASMLRASSLDTLRNADQNEAFLVKALMDDMDSRIEGATKSAMKMDTIIEGGQRSKGTFVQQNFAAGEMEAIQAAHMTETLTTKKGEKIIGAILEPHVAVFNKIKASNNRGDLEAFNSYVHARRMGWEVAAEPIQQDGKFFFPLTDTKANQSRWAKLYDGEMPANAMMPAPTKMVGGKRTYQALALTELAFQTANSVRELGQGALKNTNVIKHAMGQGQTHNREWWVPAKNLSRQEVVYLVDASGELRSIAHGRTRSEANSMAAQMIGEADTPMMQVDRNDMTRYFKLQDQAFDKMLDFTDPLLQTGKRTGKSVDPAIVTTGIDVLNDAINTINRQYQGVIRRTRAAYFEPQLNNARLLYNATGGDARRKGQTAWQMYVNAIYGNQNLTKETWTGKVYLGTEEIYDDLINAAHDKLMSVVRPAGATQVAPQKKVFGMFGEDQGAVFKQMQDKLGEHNPYNDTMDYMQRTYKESFPPSMKQHAAKLNQITSLLTLRLFEVGHAVLNLTSLAATMPAVIKALKKNEWETVEQHQVRIGTFGRSIDGDVGMFDATRAVMSGMHDMWNKPGFYREAAEAGYFRQDVAEMMHTITEPRQGYAESLVKKYTDVVSFISDKSEEISRAISFTTGYHIGERAGLTNKPDLFAFAHKFANETIGDYRPNNRPRIFQGAVGMPVGLFQTFAFNYYQRMFSMLENKQHAVLAVQYATQASVFGAQTVPGFKQFNEHFANNYDGTVNPVDGIRNRWGDDAADWLLYGTLSNMPKLFGAEDGISLTSRGDMAMHRVPGLWNLSQTPAASLVKNTWDATVKTMEMVKTTGGFDSQQMAEIAANYSIWRAQRNAIEIYSGVSTDRRGQLINDDTRTGVSIAARVMGLRPMREAKAMEVNHKMRVTEFAQRELMMELRDNLRATMRDGSYEDADMDRAMRNYIKAGGKPQNFANFLASQEVQSRVERSQLELQKAVKDPTRLRDAKRLMELYNMPQNDPWFE